MQTKKQTKTLNMLFSKVKIIGVQTLSKRTMMSGGILGISLSEPV